MSLSKDRSQRSLTAVAAAVAVAALPALMAGGCAAPAYQYPQASWYAGGPRSGPVDPEYVIAKAKASEPVTEADGLPAQVPPRVAASAIPDDPSQPWSPNYGAPTAIKASGSGT